MWRNAEGDGRYMALMEENSDRGFLAKWVLKAGRGKGQTRASRRPTNEPSWPGSVAPSAFWPGALRWKPFASQAFPGPLRTGIALFLIIIGMFIRAGAAVRWRNIESSMSHGKALPLPLPLPLTVPILGQGDAVAAEVVAVLVAVNP
jgi:putative membrane protein